MKNIWIVLSFLLLSVSSTYTDVGFAAPRSVENNSISRPYFYRITKGKEVHYLLGTYHMVFQWKDFSQSVHAAFREARNIITETEYAEQWRSYLKISFDDLAVSQTQNPNLSAENRQKLRDLGFPESLIPTLADDNCFGLLFYPHIEKFPFYQMDADIYLRAKDAGKKTVKLDTEEILTAARAPSSSSSSSCSVSELLNELSIDKILEIGQIGIDGYLSGNLDVATQEEDPAVVYRNQMWIPTLIETFHQGSSFVAVGVNHLWGSDGLLTLLRSHGYSIQRM